MLILGRELGECVFIHNDIKVYVMDVSGGKVRLGIEAPDEIPINRAEVVDPKEKQRAVELRESILRHKKRKRRR